MQRFVSIALIVVGLGLAMLGLLAGLFYLGLPVVSPDARYDLLQINTVAMAVLAVSGGAGSVLAWVGWRRYSGAASSAAHLPSPWWLVLLFLLALAVGEAVLQTNVAPWLFPPVHVIASMAAPLFLLALAASLLRPSGLVVQRRDVALQVAGGAVLATGLAIVIEVILVALLALAAALIVALTPGGSARLETLVAQLSRPEVLSDPAFLQSLLSSPLVLIGAGLVIALGAPLIEEFSKSVGVVLIAAGRARLTPGEAFLWGVAAGAGFAITETMFNVVTVLPAWGGPLMLRSATAVVHCLAAGLMGLAWQAWLSGERRWRLPALYGLAVVIHGLWNGVAGLASVLQAQGTLNANLLVGAGGTLLVFALAGLFVINSGLFIYIGRRLGQPPVMALAPLPVESTVTPEV